MVDPFGGSENAEADEKNAFPYHSPCYRYYLHGAVFRIFGQLLDDLLHTHLGQCWFIHIFDRLAS
jgi:hypothetical protein